MLRFWLKSALDRVGNTIFWGVLPPACLPDCLPPVSLAVCVFCRRFQRYPLADTAVF